MISLPAYASQLSIKATHFPISSLVSPDAANNNSPVLNLRESLDTSIDICE